MTKPLAKSLYLHTPFCRRKCRYCDFRSWTPADGEMDRYVRAALGEMTLRRGEAADLETVYFGGGTPSFLGAARLSKLFESVAACFSIAVGAEVTVEANPIDVTPGWASACLDAGFNRLSLGVQSLDDEELKFLGRLHDSAGAMAAVSAARKAGFANLGIDLIYGLPGQTVEKVRQGVTEAVTVCQPDHVSAYQLTYAPETPLGRDLEAGRIQRLSENEEFDLFMAVHETLAGLGYPAYEVSNFAPAPEKRSRHNLNYWNHSAYVGCGPAAHGFSPPGRWWNLDTMDEYARAVEDGRKPVAGEEILTQDQLACEFIMLALRMAAGVDLDAYQRRFGADLLETKEREIEGFTRDGVLQVKDRRPLNYRNKNRSFSQR